MTIELISELARYHCSNYSGGWGNAWQSALWAENIGCAAWLLWDDVPAEDRINVINMVIYEADRFIDYTVPYYQDAEGNIVYEGDTKGEENAWNSRILALATCMLPEHEHANLWESKMVELLVSSTAKPSDLNGDETIDGYVVSKLLNGSNINEDGTVVNHNKIHSDYSAVIAEGMSDTVIVYLLAGREVPEAATFNIDSLYDALVNVDLGKFDDTKVGHHFYERTEDGCADYQTNMPGTNDWGGKWYASYYLMDTISELFDMDESAAEGLKATYWANQHLNAVYTQVKNDDGKSKGQYFAEGENSFVSGETYMMQNMCKAYMLRDLLQ